MVSLTLNGRSQLVRLAKTSDDLARGLIGSTPEASLLMLLPYIYRWPITMKHMTRPLDVFFLDSNLAVVDSVYGVKPEYPHLYWPGYDNVRFILESPVGAFGAPKVGDEVAIS